MEREYVVTLYRYEDLDQFYEMMETDGGIDGVPHRCVDCVGRVPISLCTHYRLTEEEASELENNPMVAAVELTHFERGMEPVLSGWTQTSNFSKDGHQQDDVQWGLYRCIHGENTANWGDIFDPGAFERLLNQTISADAAGRHVDIVISDRGVRMDHPEFREFADGTGNLRSVEYNWFQHSSDLGYTTPATYDYTKDGALDNSSHGTGVATIIAGNTNGWAKKANVYSIALGYSGVSSWSDYMFNYLRTWHNAKQVNPETGRVNPTIVNMSWGWKSSFTISGVTSIVYRGNTLDTSSMTDQQKIDAFLERGMSYSIMDSGTQIQSIGGSNYFTRVGINECLRDGIIFVWAAGNEGEIIDTIDGDDWDNYFRHSSSIHNNYYMRGADPGRNDSGRSSNVIAVGNIHNALEGESVAGIKTSLGNFSARGPGIDVFAPGTDIICGINSAQGYYGFGNIIIDSRDSTHGWGNGSGTSFAAPEVTGVLACALELNPNMTQQDCRQLLVETSKPNQIFNTTFVGTGIATTVDSRNLANAADRYLFYKRRRPDSGVLSNNNIYSNRQPDSSGVKYPRPRVTITKSI